MNVLTVKDTIGILVMDMDKLIWKENSIFIDAEKKLHLKSQTVHWIFQTEIKTYSDEFWNLDCDLSTKYLRTEAWKLLIHSLTLFC